MQDINTKGNCERGERENMGSLCIITLIFCKHTTALKIKTINF